MSDRTITLTVPEAIFRRAEQTAMAASLSVEDVFSQSIGLMLPLLENDLSLNQQADLSVLALKSDEQLRTIALAVVDLARQSRLEQLASTQKERPLTVNEQFELESLMDFSYAFMLRKAEAMRLLAWRGHHVFPDAGPEMN